MTHRIVATVLALLLPLGDAAQQVGCGRPLDRTDATAMAMDAQMSMGEESTTCGSGEDANPCGDHGRPCSDTNGDRHDCPVSGSCGAPFVAVADRLAPLAAPIADRVTWSAPSIQQSPTRHPEPPPPRR